MQYVNISLQISSAILAIVAAMLWAKSARIKTPDKISAYVFKPDMGPIGEPLGGKYMGHVYSSDLNDLVNSLRKQSSLSAFAAYFAAGAAVLQGINIAMPAA